MKKILIISSLFFLFATSCKKLNNGVNVDPNNPTDIGTRYDLLINGAELSTIIFFEGNNARLGGMWTRTFTGSDRQYQSLYNYNTTSGDYDDNWERLYAYILPNAKIAEQKATELNDKTSAGIAQTLQAMALGTATALWGDIPFTEAGDPVKFPTPKFDAQTTVYTGLQSLLDKAIANLNANVGTGPGAKDFFYLGDRLKWMAAAYTLKARYYLHTKQYDLAVTNASLGISSAANNMVAPHGNAPGSDLNLYYAFLARDRFAYMSAEGSFAASLLIAHNSVKTNETGRYNYLFKPLVYSLDPNYSSTGFFKTNGFFPILTYQNNQLILAEANIKKASPDANAALAALNSVRAYYNAGGSVNTGSTVISTTGAKYLPYVLADFPTNADLLREILVERYLSLIAQVEQYNDIRRTKNYLGIPPVKGTVIPQRFLYAQSEINTNPNTPVLTAADLFKPTPVNTTPY